MIARTGVDETEVGHKLAPLFIPTTILKICRVRTFFSVHSGATFYYRTRFCSGLSISYFEDSTCIGIMLY